jgi:ribulose-phosphate 3-epimerase
MTTVGPPYIKGIKTDLLKDTHLMIDDPLEKLDDYVAAGSDIITVHMESTRHIHRALQYLGTVTNANDPDRGILRGIALNPGTPVESILPLIDDVDMVTLLAINPGWGGQSFLPSTYNRIRLTQKIVRDSGRDILICVDGGIKKSNIREVAESGVDLIVTGSAVFDGKAPAENSRFMLQEVEAAEKTSDPGPRTHDSRLKP